MFRVLVLIIRPFLITHYDSFEFGGSAIAIATEQAVPTDKILKKVSQFLDYLATHLDATVTYKASDMVLAIHSDASYLGKPKTQSWAGGHYFMSRNDTNPPNNAAVLNVAKVNRGRIGCNVCQCKNSCAHCAHAKTLQDLGHPQTPTPTPVQVQVQTDNSTATALGVINKNRVLPSTTKAMNMWFYWLNDRGQREYGAI